MSVDVTDPVIQSILARLAAVEQEAGTTEQAQANYLTIDPVTHTIGATFTGQINAQGIILPSAPSNTTPAPNLNAIKWERSDNGALILEIVGIDDGTNEGMLLQSFATAHTHSSEVELQTLDVDSSVGCQFLMQSVQSIAQGQIQVHIDTAGGTGPGGITNVILQQDSSSSYLQFGGQFKSQVGTGTFTWPGAVNVATTGNIVPTWTGFTAITGVLFCTGRTTAGNACFGGAINFGTLFQGELFCPAGAPAVGQQTPFAWFAWGT